MITAIIRNKENTLVLELPHSIYDIYEKLQSIGIMQPPKQIPLTDNEDEDIGVKLFSESNFGRHLLLTLNERNTIADANMLTLVIGAASEDIQEELEQNILYDQYDSMDEVISAVRQMTQDAGPVKAVFFCPLIGNIDEGDGDMFTVGDSYLADSADEISDALNRYTANDENDMAAYSAAPRRCIQIPTLFSKQVVLRTEKICRRSPRLRTYHGHRLREPCRAIRGRAENSFRYGF